MTSIEICAPAKVNLFLKILGKRKDGYHNILTVFERIALEDRITISKIPSGIEIVCDKPITKNPKDNLAYKAAKAILEKKKIKVGVKILIRKNIPISAGLGGGSSDAAAVLTGINRLFRLGLDKKGLMAIGSGLGADIPFFILDETFAVGRGIGDKISIIKSSMRFWHLLIYPGFGVSTARVYADLKEPNGLTLRPCSGSSSELLSRSLTTGGRGVKIRPSEFPLHNDLQATVVKKRPVIGEILRRLANLSVLGAIVSGSGPSSFCLYESKREAIAARRRLFRELPAVRRKGWQAFVVGTKD